MNLEIAVVGMSCRFPGGISDAAALWTALLEGRDLVGAVPPDRFAGDAFRGGFLDRVDAFDAAFFGISPREAAFVDPQQRLLLEMTAEAFDDAGLDAAGLAGSGAAVYVGVSAADYGSLQHADPGSINAYTNLGNALSITANRISYFFDLHGPSMAIDTACSSGLVALHQGCQALRSGESGLAVVAGINVLVSPYPFVGFAKAMMLSPHGRSAAFGAGADGYVRAEGGGVLVLKPLAAALTDGDRIHAVIRATGVNSDGRTVGVSLPNVDAQRALLQAVYRDAGVNAGELAYFEAHGTGTPTGDPIECRAIGDVLGRARPPDRPLPIGSIKTNVGHLEPASGLAGLIKAILVLRHREIPPSLHGTPPNPAIDFAGLNLAPVGSRTPCDSVRPLIVGVNSFGFGGTNAHAVLGEAPASAGADAVPRSAFGWPLVVSARSPAALAAAARAFADLVAGLDGAALYDVCYTACRRRTRHALRVATLGANGAELAAALRSSADDSSGVTALAHGRVGFVFSGNGSQWAGMGADLLALPAFSEAVQRVDALLAPKVGWSVIEELRAPAERSRLGLTEVAQPALFAVQLGLVALLAERGIAPVAVAGHSVGEVAAAYAAGIYDLDTAVHVILERSRAQAATRGAGKMAALALPPAEAQAAIAPYGGALEIAGINSDRDVTLSGDAGALAALGTEMKARGVPFHQLDLDYAFHSRAMDPIAGAMRARLGNIATQRGEITFVSTVTGAAVGSGALDAEYWWHNVRQPVRFADAIRFLLDDGVDALVEIGPHAILEPYLRKLCAMVPNAAAVGTLRRHEPGLPAIARAIARLMAADARVDWNRWFPRPGRVAELPAYPWQRERHWNGDPSWWDRHGERGAIEHPFLGRRLPALEPTWHNTIDPAHPEWLRDHFVGAAIVVPGAAYVDVALSAGRRALGGPVEALALEFARALSVGEHGSMALQVSLSAEDGAFRVASRPGEGDDWQLNVSGRVQRLLAPEPTAYVLSELQARMPAHVPAERHYREIAAIGLPYGPAFRVIEDIAIGDGEALGRYRASEARAAYDADPTIVDGAFQVVRPLLGATGADGLFLPSAIGRVRSWQVPAPTGFIYVRLRRISTREITADVTLLDEAGRITVEMEGCRFRKIVVSADGPPEQLCYVMRAAATARGDGPRPALAFDRLADAIRAEAERLAPADRDARDCDYERRADDLCAQLATDALATIGARGVAPRYERLLATLRTMSRERRPDAGTAPAQFARLVRDFPEYAAELMLLGRCGTQLADVVLERADPLELLFPERGVAAAEHLYDSAPFARFPGALIAASVRHIVRDWPADRPLRVLEIGAGTGGTTAALLAELPPERTRYTFTDVSEVFLLRAQERFAAYDFLEYRRFDVEQGPLEQGFAAGTFDLVIASNVLHATADLRQSVSNAAALLGADGLLFAVEEHDRRSLSLVFGLLEGWWRFADAPLRTRSPLLAPAQWPSVLRAAGFAGVALFGDGPQHAPRRSVIVAQRAAIAAPAAVPAAVPPGELWIVAVEDAGDDARSTALAAALRERGAEAVRAFPSLAGTPAGADAAALAFDRRDDWRALIDAASSAPAAVRVAFVLGAAEPDLCAQAVARAMTVRALAGALALLPADVPAQLCLIAHAGVAADAPAWGVLRTLANEHPRIGQRRIAVANGVDVRRIAAELVARDDEDEIVLEASGSFVPRVVPARAPIDSIAGTTCALALRDQGSAYTLAWVQRPAPVPGPGQVAIAVAAVGLNYHDVLWANGRLSDEAVEAGYIGARLGMECAGVVTAVGANVRGYARGDRVYAFAPGSFASDVVTDAGFVARIPEGMPFAEAATLPTAMNTVHYSLVHLARLQKGETILVHGAAGGVGLAAVQYAQHVGARIIATAGAPDKRTFLRLLGVDHVLDSRTVDFAEQVMELTDGRGVDVVLNSLAGEALRRNLDLLRPFGRMIELGKRDFYANARLGLRPFRNNVSFYGVDLDQLMLVEPARSHVYFAEMAARIDAGLYRPLPYRVYPAARVEEAFRLLARSRHLGKIVVTLDDVPVEATPAPLQLDSDGTYLVVGGTGGFGARAAAWLARRGARRLALVSRRGAAHPEAAATCAALDALGASATVHALDAGDEAAVAALVADLARGGTPLRGVVHAAMVLDDAALADLTPERFRAALDPKLRAGIVLDRVTRTCDLQLFVAFSSATTFFGNPGQANYVAGNLFLESLVRERRAKGLPGLAVAWGAIDEAGYVARSAGLADAMRHLGVRGLTPHEALAALDDLLAGGTVVAAVGRFDWRRIGGVLPALAQPRFAALAAPDGSETPFAETDVRAVLDGLGAADAAQLVEGLVAELVAGVVRMPAEQLDRRRLLADLGMDSLMAIELRTAVESRFGFDIPIIELTGAASVRDVARLIATRLGLDGAPV